MKSIYTVLIIFLAFVYKASAQTSRVASPDTIRKGTSIFVGANVFCFNATLICHGIATERHYYGPTLFASAYLQPGDVVIIEQAMATAPNGTTVRLRDKKYVIR